ncbi:hypothetical protein ACFQX7_27545 [Luedemannella flava]
MFGENLRTSLGQDDRERVVDLLRAVAFAFGRGLPWYQIWPRVANAVSLNGRAYGDADARWLLNHRYPATWSPTPKTTPLSIGSSTTSCVPRCAYTRTNCFKPSHEQHRGCGAADYPRAGGPS